MAKSNRSKKGASAGLTRNQALKSQRASAQQDRLRRVVAHQEELEANKGKKKDGVTVTKKVVKPNMTKPAKRRRTNVLEARIAQLKAGTKELQPKTLRKLDNEAYQALLESSASTMVVPLTDEDIARINKEIETLKKRGAVVA